MDTPSTPTTRWLTRLLLVASCQASVAALTFPANATAEQAKPQSEQTAPLTKPPLVVHHKQAELSSDNSYLFEVELIVLALDKTLVDFGPYQLEPVQPVNRVRSLQALSQNTYPNLVLLLSYEDELASNANLRYIPQAVDSGIFSYRLCFVRDELKQQAAQIRQLEQLKPFQFGSGTGWVDSKILRHNGLQVVESDSLLSLYRMTKAGRIDFFCRGLGEYYNEQKQQALNLTLSADSSLLLYYPLPKFFFAHKDNQALLQRLQQGLARAKADGSLAQLWQKHQGPALAAAQLSQRRLITLQNPLIRSLPPALIEDSISAHTVTSTASSSP